MTKISHTPNTIKYSTPLSGEEGQKLKRSKVSTVIHTELKGPNREAYPITSTHEFGSHPDVHRVEHVLDKDERKPHPEDNKIVQHHIGEAEKLMKGHTYGHLAGHETHMRTYVNSTVKSGERPSVEGYKAHLAAHHDKQIAKVKMEKTTAAKTQAKNADLAHVEKNKKAFQRSFDIHHHMQQATNHLARGLDKSSKHPFETSIGGKKSGGEGYVANGLKIVNREEFSKANLAKKDAFKK
jgi:hypothetical protein